MINKIAQIKEGAATCPRCRPFLQAALVASTFAGMCFVTGCDAKPVATKTKEERKVFYGEKPTAEQIRQAEDARSKRGGGPPPAAQGKKP